MSSAIRKSIFSGVLFTTGFALFAKAWPANSIEHNQRPTEDQRIEVLNKIKDNHNFKNLLNNQDVTVLTHSSKIPKVHQTSHVSQGLLFGPQRLEIDPIVFMDEKNKELHAYYHLGKNLASFDGKIHNGVISTILDEFLCFCGFPYLPSKRGVTAKLSIDFLERVEPDATILLRAKVIEHKGRKVIIGGHVETLDAVPKKLAEANCVLVEPKWFKYFGWLPIFE
ncbi:hypothetical protein WICMUC_005743 [Wickerhamomyces mucosus]|uniref:Thioesterase domain-containing protein n=1 Tax=Wickerhamomyces mucosus TaxID=1378264 RepID=A0A9P8P212_9ASCO|nr:hypothetical protein WICMUC_005743 [Wickerhamomyces mucosus]